MIAKADKCTQVFGAGVILTHLNSIQQEIEGVRQARDIEYVHRMRVASRRLRNALNLFSVLLPPKKLEKWQASLRRLTKDLGAVRDLDVQISLVDQLSRNVPQKSYLPGLQRLLLRLNQKRTKLQTEVLLSLGTLEASGTLNSLAKSLSPFAIAQESPPPYTPMIYGLGFRSIIFRLDTFLSFEPFIERPECVLEMHSMRIAGKHLRYSLEAFAPLYGDEVSGLLPTMRKIQDQLGEIHDSDVWCSTLPLFIDKERQKTIQYFGNPRNMGRLLPGFNYFLQNRQENRERNYHEFVTFWQTLKVSGTWSKLRETVAQPGKQLEENTPMNLPPLLLNR